MWFDYIKCTLLGFSAMVCIGVGWILLVLYYPFIRAYYLGKELEDEIEWDRRREKEREEVPYGVNRTRCPVCGKENMSYRDLEMVKCPKCGAKTDVFEAMCCWENNVEEK